MKLTKGRISKIKKAVKQSRKRSKGRRTAAGSRRTLRDKKSKHFLYESLKRRRRGGKRRRMQRGGKLSDDQLAELPYGGNWQDAKKAGNRLAIRVIMDANKSGKVPTEGEEGWENLQKAMAAVTDKQSQDVTKQEQPAAVDKQAPMAAAADPLKTQPELDQSAMATAPVRQEQEPDQLATASVAPDDQPGGTQPELGSAHDVQPEATDSRKLDADSLAHLKTLTDSLLSSDSLSSDDKKQLEEIVARVSPDGIVSSADQTALTHLSEVAGSAGWKPPVEEQDTADQQAIREGVTASTQAIMNVVNEQRAQDPQSPAPALAGRTPELDAQLAGILSGSVSGGNRPWLVLGTQVDATAEGVVPARELETVHAGAGSVVGTVVELKEPAQEDVAAVQTSEQTFKFKSPVPPGQSYIFIVVGGRLLSANLLGLAEAMRHYNAYAGHTATAAENAGDFAGLAAHIVTMLGTDEAEQGLAKIGLRGLGRTSMTPKQQAARKTKAAEHEALEEHGVTSAVQALADEDDADAATLAAEREGGEAAAVEAVKGTEKHPVEATVVPVDAVPAGDSAKGGHPGKQCMLGIWVDPEKGIYKGEDKRPPSAPIFLLKRGAPSQPGCKDTKGPDDDDDDDDDDEKSGISGGPEGGAMTKPGDSAPIAHAVAVPMAAAPAGTTTAAPAVATAAKSPGTLAPPVAHPLEDPAGPPSQTPVAQQSQSPGGQQSQTSGGSRSRKRRRNRRRITKKRRKHRKKHAKRTKKRRRTRKKN